MSSQGTSQGTAPQVRRTGLSREPREASDIDSLPLEVGNFQQCDFVHLVRNTLRQGKGGRAQRVI